MVILRHSAGFDKFEGASSADQVIKMPPKTFRGKLDNNTQQIVIVCPAGIRSVKDVPCRKEKISQFIEDSYVI